MNSYRIAAGTGGAKGDKSMEHKTRTKALSLLLTLAMLVGLMPGLGLTAYAETEVPVVDLSTVRDIYYQGGLIYRVNGDVILTGTPTDKLRIEYQGNDYEVTLDNVNPEGAKETYINGSGKRVNVKLKGTSQLYWIGTSETVTIDAAASGGTVILSGSNIEPLSGSTVTINGGTVKAKATGDRARNAVERNLVINGGAVYLDGGTSSHGRDNDAVSGTVTGTLYGWNGSAWINYSSQRYATTDNTSGDPANWSWDYVPSAHTHAFTYSADGSTITATCTPTEDGDVCTLEYNTATLTIAAPLHTAVGDGKSADAQITDEGDIQGDATVSYFAADTNGEKTGSVLSGAPTEAGKYWAEITLGTATAHVVYEITNPTYSVTISDNLVGGTVTADKTSGKYGDTVTLTVTPETGFTIKTVKYNDTAIIAANEGVYSFTMPAADVTVSAEFEGNPFGITTEVSPANGGTVAIGGTGVVTVNNVTTAKAGSTVTLTVDAYTGFTRDSVTVKKANGDPVNVTDNKFTMPTSDVTVSATFAGHDTTATLDVTGNEGTTCTAKLLNSSYEEIKSVTKKGGEPFILLVNSDEGYDFNVTYGMDSPVTLTEFTEDEYKAYVAYAKDNNITLSSNMVLAWVTMPGVADNSVTLTVGFSKLQTFTILYQPTGNPDNVWCKFAYAEAGSLVTDSAQMKSDTVMGDGTKVYSLKVTAAFSPEKVTFATTKEAVDAVATDDMTACSAKQSAAASDWENSSGGEYVVIGGNAKTVVVAFVSDASNMAVYNSDTVEVDEGTGTDGVTYRVAIVTDGSAGTVKAPANTLTKEGYDFAGWRGFEGTAPHKTEKIYNAGDSISVSENTTLNAVWNRKKSTVTLNLNGGTGNSSVDPVTYGEKLPTLENPTRSGFAFDGWKVSKAVTENGVAFAKGSPFDLDTPITADLQLEAQWKHVHSYTCYRISTFGNALAAYAEYDSAIHVAICGCNDIQLMAHEFDSSGKCACGYQKPGAPDVTLNISYGQWSSETYTEKMKGMPETAKQGQEVSICAPDAWGDLQFSKWQYSTDNSTWYDLTADAYVSFLIPATMYVRALYVNPVTVPQVDLSARQYDDHTVVNGKTYTMDNILFQMNYKLPDGYTFVDAGIRLGDNAGISYYELKEITYTADAEAKALVRGFAALGVLVSTDPTNARFAREADSSETRTFYEVHKNSVLDEMTADTLAEHMYESKPINVEKYDPIYWEAKAKTKGMSGSMATLPPLRFAQKDNQDHWIYGIGWLRYKDKDGNIQTIYTEALATTVNGVLQNSTGTVTKVGN